MSENKCCGDSPKVVFTCSGASDVGAISDQAARRVSRKKVASMGCLAAINNQLGFVMDSVKTASKIVAIDGCSENCVKLTLEKAGVVNFHQILLSDLGMEKGHSLVNQKHIEMVYNEAQRILGD